MAYTVEKRGRLGVRSGVYNDLKSAVHQGVALIGGKTTLETVTLADNESGQVYNEQGNRSLSRTV